MGVYSATYDAASNRLNLVELDGSRVTYGYDEAYQPTTEVRSGTWPIPGSTSFLGPVYSPGVVR